MKKKISFSTTGKRADIGVYTIYRILPNSYARTVGPFVFLDYAPPVSHSADEPKREVGNGAHPHRGIATLTYVLSGVGEHRDSAGNNGTITSGGTQWMKAGNGVIHDESLNADPQKGDGLTHSFQFWVNLPAKNKAESPEYLAIQADEVPQQLLPGNSGWIKVIVGEYENLQSIIPTYSRQFLYHLRIETGKPTSIDTEPGMEYGAFVAIGTAEINNTSFKAGEFIGFDQESGVIEITNQTDTAVELLVFGGETYTESIVSEGPFVMNTHQEIAQAYQDFHEGKYGKIDYIKK